MSIPEISVLDQRNTSPVSEVCLSKPFINYSAFLVSLVSLAILFLAGVWRDSLTEEGKIAITAVVLTFSSLSALAITVNNCFRREP